MQAENFACINYILNTLGYNLNKFICLVFYLLFISFNIKIINKFIWYGVLWL